MSDDSAEIAAPHYRAFISYSHADGRFAGWLHRKLEGARLPDKKRLSPIFFDRAELAAGPDLSAQVREALAQSAALVVIASPAARVSRWVGQEIALFRALHPDRPILAALIEGEPADAFPDALLSHDGAAIEPLAADFRKGKDGKRLGLLKIVAGLTAQPLDRLVQRDAQTRQRRVMAVTAGAVLLSLILSAALVLAIRARAEAERQRGEAEGLVEYMLTDLRDKLKGVGRLDVMDAVNQRVMERYEKEAKLDSLPIDLVLRRSRTLHAMAEDSFSTTGEWTNGMRGAEQALRITSAQVARKPADSNVLITHAQSEYWVGYGWFLRRKADKQALDRARKHWTAYAATAVRLVQINPGNADWQTEAASASANLCALELTDGGNPAAATTHCRNSRQALQEVAAARPSDLNAQLDLATALAWEADAMAARGDLAGAQGLRQKHVAMLDRLSAKHPLDTRIREGSVLARIGLAKVLFDQGKSAEAKANLARARSDLTGLMKIDPRNADWRSWLSLIATTEQQI